MEASAPGQDVVGAKADCNVVGKEGLKDIDRRLVVRRSILRNNHGGVTDIEVHIARRDDVAIFVRDPAGRGQGDNVTVADKQLVIIVTRVDERAPLVMFLINPNIVDFRQTKNSQSMGFEAISDTRLVN